MEIKTFGVVGAGQMGNGIAQVAAMSGLDVVMNDIKTEFVERGLATITKILTRSVDKGKMTEDGKVLPLDVKVGDKVLFGKYSGTEIKIEGKEYLMMREDDVLGVVE